MLVIWSVYCLSFLFLWFFFPKDVCVLLLFPVTVHVIRLFSIQTFHGQRVPPQTGVGDIVVYLGVLCKYLGKKKPLEDVAAI